MDCSGNSIPLAFGTAFFWTGAPSAGAAETATGAASNTGASSETATAASWFSAWPLERLCRKFFRKPNILIHFSLLRLTVSASLFAELMPVCMKT
jgi:hypothetical protein